VISNKKVVKMLKNSLDSNEKVVFVAF